MAKLLVSVSLELCKSVWREVCDTLKECAEGLEPPINNESCMVLTIAGSES